MNGLLQNGFPPPPPGRTGWPWTEECEAPSDATGLSKITIVTASFNQGAFIEETIRSVVLQNYPNLEYIIIDGGSTDETVSVIRKYERYLTAWISEKDKGQSDAINKGIRRATGDIFNWLNSDDLLAKDALRTVAGLLQDETKDVACCRVHNFGERDVITEPSSCFSVKNDQALKPNINQPGTFFRMRVIHGLGPLEQELHYCMDLEWWIRYLLRHDIDRVVVSDEVVARFREHDTSKTGSQSLRFITDKLNLFSAILAKKEALFRPLGDYRFPDDLSHVPLAFLQKLFSATFYDSAVIAYGKREMARVRELLSYVDREALPGSLRVNFDRMKFRARFFPRFLFHLKG